MRAAGASRHIRHERRAAAGRGIGLAAAALTLAAVAAVAGLGWPAAALARQLVIAQAQMPAPPGNPALPPHAQPAPGSATPGTTAPLGRSPVVRAPSRPSQAIVPDGGMVRRPALPPTSVVQPLSPLEAFGAVAAPQTGLPATPARPAAAPAPAPPPEPRAPRCMPADGIRETTVEDDRTIRFRMRGGDVYEVRLRNRCYGLAFDGSFYYHLNPSRQLCERMDWIVARSGSRCQIESIEPTERKAKRRKVRADGAD